MAGKPRDYEAELRHVMNALAEAAVVAPDEEILAEVREHGLDPETEARRVRDLLLTAVKKETRRRAQQQYEQESARLRSRQYSLPEPVADQRALLAAFIAARPDLHSMVTAQFRELDELSDSDIESTLKKLDDLGLLAEFLHDRDRQ